MDADADLTPDGCGRLIAAALAKLDLTEVTLIGNDSGGAYSQIAVAAHTDRVDRLVLNSCETPYDAFTGPVLFAWGPEDRIFPIAHAERYAAELADGRLVAIEDAYSFTPEDQPRRLAEVIADFHA